MNNALKTKEDAVAVLGASAGSEMWAVYHPDGEEVGLTPRRFPTQEEAETKADEWNRDYPGHVVIPPNTTMSCTVPKEKP
jgi:hypothetical protein